MAYTYQMRKGPTSYNQVKHLKYYTPPLNPTGFAVNPATGGNCTWWAWGRFLEVMAVAGKGLHWTFGGGDACRFAKIMTDSGSLKWGEVPKPGAIICWGYNGKSNGGPGHVAFVEKVNMVKGQIESIEISQSGWSSGPLPNEVIKPGTGKVGTGGYVFKRSLGQSYFNGFIYNPVDFGNPAGAIESDIIAGGEVTAAVNMEQRVKKLYSSDNFDYLEREEEQDSPSQALGKEYRNRLKKYFSSNLFTPDKTAAIPEPIAGSGPVIENKELFIKTPSSFSLSESLVQAPFVELDIGGYIVGSYHSNIDDYPNYISRLDVEKINGEINKYTIGMIYQIRPGEDPTLIDKLLSKVRYNKIQIRYGDCESGALFKDSEAIITNVATNRDYVGSRITYTIYATSACNYVTSVKFDFKATEDKPSNIIRELLYNSGEKSELLLRAFPGMRNITEVESKGYIPNNDSKINIEAKTNVNLLTYINYLVGCMSNITNSIDDVIRNSMYFINYRDDKKGSYFTIDEVKRTISVQTNNIYEITVGYPDGNDVYDFKVNTNESWAMLYNNMGAVSEYIYGINNNGENVYSYSPNIVSSSNILNEIQKNWWTQVTTYPITAQLTMRGILKPVNLMDYIKINVVFYGQKHITSGLYVVTGEKDALSGSGFYTTLSLQRVGD